MAAAAIYLSSVAQIIRGKHDEVVVDEVGVGEPPAMEM